MLDIARMEEPRGLRLAGEVDLANAAQLGAALEAEVREGGDVTLEVSELKFIDSQGLQTLIRALEGIEGRGRVILVGVRDSLRRLIKVMGLERFPTLVVE